MNRPTPVNAPPLPRRLLLGAAFALALAVILACDRAPADAQESRPAASAGAPGAGDGSKAKSDEIVKTKPDGLASAASDAGTQAKSDDGAGPKSDDGAGPKSDDGVKTKSDEWAKATRDDASPRRIEIRIGGESAREGEKATGAAEARDADPYRSSDVGDSEKAPAGKGTRSIIVKKDGKTVTVTGIPDREFDSVGELAQKEPALTWMIFGIVAVVFLAPVLAIALILGYRMRKARMLNETMLKLAEKGIVPPAEVFEAVMGNSVPAAASGAPSGTPGQGQPYTLRKRAAWSDLRKGIIMGAIGLALSAHSEMSHGTSSSIGLILLFVGIGYVALWWFEQRRMRPADENARADHARADNAKGIGDRGPGAA